MLMSCLLCCHVAVAQLLRPRAEAVNTLLVHTDKDQGFHARSFCVGRWLVANRGTPLSSLPSRSMSMMKAPVLGLAATKERWQDVHQ